MTADPSSTRFRLHPFHLAIFAALAYRFLHFAAPIDDPHAFRQCETAWMAWDFYLRGIDLFAPSVCWLGPHRTLILEFPLHEAIVALAWHVFGPHHAVARVITLLAFTASAFFLHAIVHRLHGPTLARLTTVLYAVSPLALFYSRAIHIDFTVLALALASVDCWMRAIATPADKLRPAIIWLTLGALAATAAFLMKAPYVFYLYIPLAFYARAHRRLPFAIRALPLLLLPPLAFILWRLHAESVNAAAPDWQFIPGYTKFTGMSDWYFGSLTQRLDPAQWSVILERLSHECIPIIATPLFLIGLFTKPSENPRPLFFYLWLSGLLIYLLVFFNLNFVHNYYQIPFLPVAAFFTAAGLDAVTRRITSTPSRYRILVAAALALIAANALWTSERRYYWLDTPTIAAGEILQRELPPDTILIAVHPDTHFNDPRFLYRARRPGWALTPSELTPSLIDRLSAEGAHYLAILTPPPDAGDPWLHPPLPFPRVFPLDSSGWLLRVYSLALPDGDYSPAP